MWQESLAAYCVSIRLDGLNTVKGAAVPSKPDPSIDSFYHMSCKAGLLRDVEQQQEAYIFSSRLHIKYTVFSANRCFIFLISNLF
jgi:hypothetical protein